MRRLPGWWLPSALAAVALLVFVVLQRQLPGAWPWLGAHPEVIAALERSLDDQRRLAQDHPDEAGALRARFEETSRLLARLRIVELSRPALSARYRIFLWVLFAILLLAAALLYVAHRRRLEARLARMRESLERLSRGEVGISVGDRGRDTLARVSQMIERVSRTAAEDRRRAERLEHLAAWQEGARRVAHEIRTPLTAAILDLSRLEDRVGSVQGLLEHAERLRHEMRTIQTYVDRLASFARLPEPVLRTSDLGEFVARFVEAFRDAFPPAMLADSGGPDRLYARFDADLLRQVLANLCRNAGEAADGHAPVQVTVYWSRDGGRAVLDVVDDGPGVPFELRPRLFRPYVTRSPRGSGMGLGLAISRKILLDHGGDLALIEDDARGAHFRLWLAAADDEAPGRADGERTQPS